MRIRAAALFAAVALAGPAAATVAAGATADIKAADGTSVGTAIIRAGSNEVQVRVRGMRPGRYGIHLHDVGRCDAPSFESAGPHWNPSGRQHGRLNPHGRHRGDLPNLRVGADGSGSLSFVIAGADIWRGAGGFADADGTAVVIHAAADDERTDPSGDSGGRIACGVLTR